eukprot:5014610-Amphidinium_carterae.2
MRTEELVAADALPMEQMHVIGYALLLIHAWYKDAIRPTSEPGMDITADGDGYVETTTRISLRPSRPRSTETE